MIETLWKRYHRDICRFICYRVQPVDDAEDLLQDVFTRAYTRQAQLREPDKARAWLYEIARHAVIDYYRTHRVPHVSLDTIDVPVPDDKQRVEGAFSPETQLKHCVRELVQTLPAKYRDAVTAADLWEVPQKKLATQLGLSYSGAKTRVQRGREHLRQRLQAECATLLAELPSLKVDKTHCCVA